MVTAIQRKKSFVDKVSYITSPGRRVRTLVSTMGVFAKPGARGRIRPDRAVSRGRVNGQDGSDSGRQGKTAGWDLRVARDPAWIAPPTIEELMLLRMFDPERHFLGRPGSTWKGPPSRSSL